jgi:hypothetical protein
LAAFLTVFFDVALAFAERDFVAMALVALDLVAPVFAALAIVFAAFLTGPGSRLATALFAFFAPVLTAVSARVPAA